MRQGEPWGLMKSFGSKKPLRLRGLLTETYGRAIADESLLTLCLWQGMPPRDASLSYQFFHADQHKSKYMTIRIHLGKKSAVVSRNVPHIMSTTHTNTFWLLKVQLSLLPCAVWGSSSVYTLCPCSLPNAEQKLGVPGIPPELFLAGRTSETFEQQAQVSAYRGKKTNNKKKTSQKPYIFWEYQQLPELNVFAFIWMSFWLKIDKQNKSFKLISESDLCGTTGSHGRAVNSE